MAAALGGGAMTAEDVALVEACMLDGDAAGANSSTFVGPPPPLAEHLLMMRGLAGRLSQALEANLGDGGGDAQGLGDLLEVAGPLIGNLRNALGGLETFWRACEGQRLLRLWPGGFEDLGSRYAVGMPSRLYFKDEDGRALHPLGHQVLALRALERGRDVFSVVPTGAGKSGTYVAFGAANHAVEEMAAPTAGAAAAPTPLPKSLVVFEPLVSAMLDQVSDLNRRLGDRFAVALRRTTTRRGRHATSLSCEPLSLALTIDDGDDVDDGDDDDCGDERDDDDPDDDDPDDPDDAAGEEGRGQDADAAPLAVPRGFVPVPVAQLPRRNDAVGFLAAREAKLHHVLYYDFDAVHLAQVTLFKPAATRADNFVLKGLDGEDEYAHRLNVEAYHDPASPSPPINGAWLYFTRTGS